MYRIDAQNTTTPVPVPGALGSEGYFDVQTVHDADWANMLQESILAVIDDQALAHSKTDPTVFLAAVKSIADAKIAAAQVNLAGYISGMLCSSSNNGSSVAVSAGVCRDTTNSGTMSYAGGSVFMTIGTQSTGTSGGLASGAGNVWADPLFVRIFICGVSGENVVGRIGADVDASATNMLADLGAPYDIYRQVGWAVRIGRTGLIPFEPTPGLLNFYRINQTTSPDIVISIDETIASTGTLSHDVNVPAGTLHVGAFSIHTSSGSNADIFGNMGAPAAPAFPNVGLHNLRARADSGDRNVSSQLVISEALDLGAAVNQGSLRSRFSATTGSPELRCFTEGFFYSRELF